jgi:hypothetical protein
MAIHTVGHKALSIVDVGGCFPGVVGVLNLVTRCTELGGRGSYHRVIGNAKQRKSDENAEDNKNGRLYYANNCYGPMRKFKLNKTKKEIG